MKRFIYLLLALYFIIPSIISCSKKDDAAGKVTIFHAGSLSRPLEAIKKEFENRNPTIKIQYEASGSQQAARKISDLKKPCDIIASADYKIIDKLLIPEYTEWNIRFANNQMAICYTEKSKFAGEINEKNWYTILQRKGVVWGHSDPNLDPCGYRALMVIQLAEKYYKNPGLYKNLITNRPKENIRPKSVELLSLLQTGHMDYIWEYRSVAVQHKLKYIILPDEINLGNYKYDKNYSKASIMVTGTKPGTMMEMKGESCTYGIALLKNVENRKAAIIFLQYLLDPEGGLKIFKEMGQTPFVPCLITDKNMKKNIPEELHKFINVEN